jgi:4-hydroxy-tetrahydrodipicolinate synthase
MARGEPFRGTYTVLVTPFTADGAAVDLQAPERLVEFQIDEGVRGLIPLGSTGEFLSVSREERTAIVETVVRTALGRVPVLVGTGAEDTREAVALSREAERQDADGVMIIPPFYSVPTEDELYHHYKTVADAIGIPIMVYNNPATANVDMGPATLARLSTIPNCRYVRESTLEVTRVRDILAACDGRMEVFAGVLGYEGAWLGAVGWVAVCSNVAPRPPRLPLPEQDIPALSAVLRGMGLAPAEARAAE